MPTLGTSVDILRSTIDIEPLLRQAGPEASPLLHVIWVTALLAPLTLLLILVRRGLARLAGLAWLTAALGVFIYGGVQLTIHAAAIHAAIERRLSFADQQVIRIAGASEKRDFA